MGFRALVCRSLLALASLLPATGVASEAKVKLEFAKSDYAYLFISLGLAVLAIGVGFGIMAWALKQSPGNEKMQEVSAAIKQGALAYLRRQIKTMSFFIVLLAVGLFFLYRQDYAGMSVLGIPLAAWLSISFVLGVGASYIAGYIGMIMAVNGNARVANAALSSYKSALELAFRSGAVAGLITVGMGLLGATVIFLIAGAQAMKLLIGFGFGGSLAALFMRVGGGIYTKAADVGADLVGKVEAGIPEDDPRNAATIADNVGDNVGDCAGMAADVFESYEVTLVAAIVLGAATAAIFPDQTMWMKLILFALMARGVGIVASILGIFFVRGSDSEKVDPLTPIRRGFWVSAVIAIAGTFALAYLMMRGLTATYYVDASGATYSGLTPIPIEKIRTLGLMAAVDQQEQATAMQKAQPGQQSAAPPALKDEDYVNKANELLQQLHDRAKAQYESAKAAREQARKEAEEKKQPPPPESPLPPVPQMPEKLMIEQVQAAKGDSVANYTLLQEGQPLGSAMLFFLSRMITPSFDAEPLLLVKQEQESFMTPGQKMTVWQLMSKAQLEQATEVKPLEQVAVVPAVDGKGDLYWVMESNVKDQQAILALPGYDYTKKKVETKPGEMKREVKEGAITAVAKETRAVGWWWFAIAIGFGVIMAFLIELLTDYFVSFEKKPVREVAGASTAGPAPMIIQGFAFAMESSVWGVFAIVVTLLAPLFLFPPSEYGGFILSFYGIALVGLGLLTTTGYILAMDTFGPISDNAQGVYEMSGASKEQTQVVEGKMGGHRAVQRLDAAGNTTKALTKGFAIATAVVAAVALFHSFIEDARLGEVGLRLDLPQIFIGLLVGGAAPFLFSAFSINAVGRAAFQLIGEVRRQFQADPGILAGTSKPDYGKCVAIVTAAAQKELLGPGILAISLPIIVAFGLSIGSPHVTIGGNQYNLTGAQALGGFLAGAILSGQLLAVLLANAGGLWDNAKKTIEDGLYGGKGTEAHKAGVVCDTVGDPFKDTAGPALNPLIKVMNLVALLLAPVVILPLSNLVLGVIVGIAVVALGVAVFWSKRGSIGSEIAKTAASN